jgi:predicted enzyme related to lactoylglutathione lyase
MPDAVELEAGLVGRDRVRLCAFYTDVLGFELADRFEASVGTVYKFRRGAARLKLFFPNTEVDPARDVEPWTKPGGWRYAALLLERAADVDELAGAVVAGGGHVRIAPANHRPGARMALVTDPEGNAWELLFEQ